MRIVSCFLGRHVEELRGIPPPQQQGNTQPHQLKDDDSDDSSYIATVVHKVSKYDGADNQPCVGECDCDSKGHTHALFGDNIRNTRIDCTGDCSEM